MFRYLLLMCLLLALSSILVVSGAKKTKKSTKKSKVTKKCRTNTFLADAIDENIDDIQDIKSALDDTTRQLMLQQFYNQERIRSEGGSGIKQVRVHVSGTKNYQSESHTGNSIMAIHEHADHIRTVGMGEFVAVLNGVEFRTRHNDYRLFEPHNTDKAFHRVNEIEFPPVPPEVLKYSSISKQANELRKWFKAFKDQDYSVRDYRKYFQPILCYLEGAWTRADGEAIVEPFESDRHFLDAQTWRELEDKIIFTSNSGSKMTLENLAFLPRKVIGMNGSLPVFAQWNYRILCHKIKNRDLPTNRFHVVEDLKLRMTKGYTLEQMKNARAARFQLDPQDTNGPIKDKQYNYGLLDELMEQIPGNDNYPGFLVDQGYDSTSLNPTDGKVKDASRYHRKYKIGNADAMGHVNLQRGFSDDNLFVAMTSHDDVIGDTFERCTMPPPTHDPTKPFVRKCKKQTQRWSYAIPLEIIYLTPLSRWNPFNIQYKGVAIGGEGRTVFADGRTGECGNSSKAYNGTHSAAYYRTPSMFFAGGEVEKDSADTATGTKCVLDVNGKVRKVRATGIRVFLPDIKGVGVIRTRYPITPIHGEGSPVWKELGALRDIALNPVKFQHMFFNSNATTTTAQNVELRTGISQYPKVTSDHYHYITLSADEAKEIKEGKKLKMTTTLNNSHQHDMTIVWDKKKKIFKYINCDGSNKCWDKHQNGFKIVSN